MSWESEEISALKQRLHVVEQHILGKGENKNDEVPTDNPSAAGTGSDSTSAAGAASSELSPAGGDDPGNG